MPAKSEKQARLFRLIRGVQKGDVPKSKVSKKVVKMSKSISPSSVKHFTKVKEIVNNFKESSEFSISKVREVEGKTLEELLSENNGNPFDKKELLTFQNKQTGFGGFGKVNFIHKKSSSEIRAEIFSNDSTKTYVFKKLANNEHEGLNNYVCFIRIRTADKDKDTSKLLYTLSNVFDNKHEEKTKILSDFIERINAYGL